jgi:hypothetical protein
MRRLSGVALVAAILAAVLLPVSAAAHSQLQSSDPAAGAVVPSPFSGPVTLTFTEALAVGSKGDLYGPGHQLIASATIDAGTMTVTSPNALAPGEYIVEWVSIADDGDLLRGTVAFSVAAAPSPSIEATASAAPTSEPSAVAPSAASATASAEAVSPSPSAAPTSDTAGGGNDVILPIVIVLIAAAVGAFYLVRRNRPG